MSKTTKTMKPAQLGCLTIWPPTKGYITLAWSVSSGDSMLGPAYGVAELMRLSLADFFADHGCKNLVFVSWWKGWLTVRAEHAPAAQALLQYWLRPACTWPGADRNWYNREIGHLAELTPPPPEHKIPPSRELDMAERLRWLDDVLFFSAVELEDPRFIRAMAAIESNWPEPVHDLARFLPPRPNTMN